MSALRSRAESPVRIHLLRKRKQTGRDTVVTYAFVEEVRLDAGRGDQRAKDFAQGSSARAVQLLRRSPRAALRLPPVTHKQRAEEQRAADCRERYCRRTPRFDLDVTVA